jgi:hypothetical protein
MNERVMVEVNTGQELKIEEWIMTKNLWEYYILSDKKVKKSPIRMAYVRGIFDEIGSVDLEELEGYIMSRTKNLNEVMPAPNFRWKE